MIVRHNLVHHTLSAGLHQHFGFNNSVTGNVFACAGGADGDVAISIGEPSHRSFSFEANVVLRCPEWASSEAEESAAFDVDCAANAVDPPVDGEATGATDAMAEGSAFTATNLDGPGGVCVRDVGAPVVVRLPAPRSWLVWWKGEGGTPNVSFESNVYSSLVCLLRGSKPLTACPCSDSL